MVNERLLRAFQPIASGAERVDTAAAEAILYEEFPRAYQLPPAARLALRPGQRLSDQEEALWDELVQHLADLGYLSEDFYQEHFENKQLVLTPERWRSVKAALQAFMEEDDWVRQMGLTEPGRNEGELPMPSDELLPLLVQRLNHLTALDGEFLLERPLKVGELSSYSRALQYRLRVLGQYYENETPPAHLDESALIRTHTVLMSLGLATRLDIDPDRKEISPEAFFQTGDVHRMLDFYIQQHKEGVLFYQLPESADAVARSEWLIVWKDKFIFANRERDFQRLIRQQTLLDYEKLKVHIRQRGEASTVYHTGQNTLGLRLIQIKLWMAGFYYGRIDGWWGPLSQQALLDLLEQEGIDKEKHISRYMVPVEDNYRALNLALVGKLLLKYDAPRSAQQVYEQQLIEAIPPSEEEAIQAALYNQNGSIELFNWASHHKRRRPYLGLKSLVVGALRGIKRVLEWVKRKVQKIAGAVISFFKTVTKRIREGVLIFAESFRRFLHFMLGKPIVSHQEAATKGPREFILTRFALDLDTVNFFSTETGSDLMTAHCMQVRQLTTGLSMFLAIATGVVQLITRLGSLATPMGWIRIGLWIARKVEDILEKRKIALS